MTKAFNSVILNGAMTDGVQNNKVKKPTNRDVARLAGVSVATVSYIINGREDMRISEATKKKVYQAINFLNYTPNPYAVGLNTNQLRSIVVRSSGGVSPLTEMEIMHFMHTFNRVCEENGYSLNYSMDKRAAKIAASACICFDMSNDEFHSLADENFIPVIAVDSLVNDPVFYQITADYGKARNMARERFGDDFCYVCIEPCNAETKKAVLNTFKNVVFLSNISDAGNIRCPNILLTQPSLTDLFAGRGFEILLYEESSRRRPVCAMECINKALNRLNVADEEHFITL